MPNYKYNKGVRKERKIVNAAKEKGLVAFRSAGSHSPIDVVIIDVHRRRIRLVQSKSDNLPESGKTLLEKKWKHLNGVYVVDFRVI